MLVSTRHFGLLWNTGLDVFDVDQKAVDEAAEKNRAEAAEAAEKARKAKENPPPETTENTPGTEQENMDSSETMNQAQKEGDGNAVDGTTTESTGKRKRPLSTFDEIFGDDADNNLGFGDDLDNEDDDIDDFATMGDLGGNDNHNDDILEGQDTTTTTAAAAEATAAGVVTPTTPVQTQQHGKNEESPAATAGIPLALSKSKPRSKRPKFKAKRGGRKK